MFIIKAKLKQLNETEQSKAIQFYTTYVIVRVVTKWPLQWTLRWSICPLAFALGSWITWFISSWERNNCLQSWANSQNDTIFTQNSNLGPFWVKIVVILWISPVLSKQFFNSQLEINHVIQQPTAKNQRTCRSLRSSDHHILRPAVHCR